MEWYHVQGALGPGGHDPQNTVPYRNETCGARQSKPPWPNKEQHKQLNSPHWPYNAHYIGQSCARIPGKAEKSAPSWNSFNAFERPHHGTTPLQAPPRPSKGIRPGRGYLLRRSFTFLTPTGHLGVPKHAPPSTTRKAAEDARMQKKKRDNGKHTPSKPSQHLLIYKARTFSANFLSVRAEHAPQRAPDTEIMTFFVCKGVKKNTRPNVYGPYRLETGCSTNQTKAIDRRTNLVPFF
jgi:hypothetical protein